MDTNLKKIIDEFKDWCKRIGGKVQESGEVYYCMLDEDACDVIEGIHVSAKKSGVQGHIELSAIGTKPPWELELERPEFTTDFEGQITIDGYGNFFGDVKSEMSDLGSELSFKVKCPCAISVDVDTTTFPRPVVKISAYTKTLKRLRKSYSQMEAKVKI